MRKLSERWYLIIMEGPGSCNRVHLQFKSTWKDKEHDFATIMLRETHKLVGEKELDALTGLDKPGYYRLAGFANEAELADYYPLAFDEIVIGGATFSLKRAR